MVKMQRVAKKKGLVRNILVIYYGMRDPRTPWYAKLVTLAAGLYLISPVDLVPDIIPIAGYIDDLVVTPLLLSVALKMLPLAVRETALQKTASKRRTIVWITIGIVVLVVLIVLLLIRWLSK